MSHGLSIARQVMRDPIEPSPEIPPVAAREQMLVQLQKAFLHQLPGCIVVQSQKREIAPQRNLFLIVMLQYQAAKRDIFQILRLECRPWQSENICRIHGSTTLSGALQARATGESIGELHLGLGKILL